jgi:hypothetical protein
MFHESNGRHLFEWLPMNDNNGDEVARRQNTRLSLTPAIIHAIKLRITEVNHDSDHDQQYIDVLKGISYCMLYNDYFNQISGILVWGRLE